MIKQILLEHICLLQRLRWQGTTNMDLPKINHVRTLWSQVAQRGGGVYFSGDIPDPPGQGPVQPALGDPAPAGGLDYMTHRGPFQPLPFCDSVILWSLSMKK